MRPLSRRKQRLAAFALLFTAIALAWNFVLLPIIDGFAERAETRDALYAQYNRNDRILAGGAGWRMATKQQSESKTQFAVVAPTRAVGSEHITRRVVQAVRIAGGTMLESQEVKTRTSPEWIGVRCDMRLSLGQLTAVLKHLQIEDPYVVVDYLSISSAGNSQSDELDNLAVRMDVSAQLRIENPPSGSDGAVGL